MKIKIIVVIIIIMVTICIIDLTILRPSGIYHYSTSGIHEFKIGMSKRQVFSEIEKKGHFLQVKTAEPSSTQHQNSSYGYFNYLKELKSSNYWSVFGAPWRCSDLVHVDNSSDYLFLFKEQKLKVILMQRRRFGELEGSLELYKAEKTIDVDQLEKYLNELPSINVYYEDK